MNIAVIYYSSTGNVHALAESVAEGAREAGATVRLRRVAELAPGAAIDANPAWRAHVTDTRDVPVARHDDLEWADGYAFGTPTRFGNIASQLKQFLDTTAAQWAGGVFTNKPATGFTSAANAHGGNEATVLALHHTFCHWGSLIVPTGYTDEAFDTAGGNPYGTSHPSANGLPAQYALAAARAQGRRLTEITAAVGVAREQAA